MDSIMDKERVLKNKEGDVVFESKHEPISDVNVEREVEARSWATRIEGSNQAGIYSYQQPMAGLLRAFKDKVRGIALGLGYEEMIFPRHYREGALEAFGWTEHPGLNLELMALAPLNPSEARSNYKLLGDPVQCLGFYETLRVIQERNGGSIPAEVFDSPLKVYEDQGGWTVRNELHERLRGGFATGFEFSGAELVWAGNEDDSYSTRWETLSAVIGFMEDMGLKYRVTISGSCSRDAKYPDLAGQEMSLYEIPTLDVEVFIPSLEAEGKNPWIEIGGGDIAGVRLTENFGLEMGDGSKIYSGCQGVGWQRIAYGMLSQKGLDPTNWPSELRSSFSTSRLNDLLE